MYGNPNAKVEYSYKQFFEEAMELIPNLRYIPQNNIPLDEILAEVAVQALLKDKPAPIAKAVLTIYRRYGEVLFKP